jgi:hypothetical protein
LFQTLCPRHRGAALGRCRRHCHVRWAVQPFQPPRISKRFRIAPTEDPTPRSPSACPPGPDLPAHYPFNCSTE